MLNKEENTPSSPDLRRNSRGDEMWEDEDIEEKHQRWESFETGPEKS